MNPFARKLADEVADMWQARALRAADGKMQRVLIVVFAKEYAAAIATLLRVALGIADISRPFLIGYAAIVSSGRIVCDRMEVDGSIRKVAVYESEDAFIKEMRDLADKLKLDDIDRIEMFRVLRKWVTSDQRIDQHGRKLAS